MNDINHNYPFDIPQLLSIFVAQSNDGYAIFDENDVLIYCNQNYAEMLFSTSPQKVINKTFSECVTMTFHRNRGIRIETDDISDWIQTAQTKRRKENFRSFEIDLLDGRWLLVTEQLIGGKFLYLHFTEITKTKKLEQELRLTKDKLFEKAYHDELTGIPNRHSFIERTSKEINKAQRNKQSLFFFLFDVDHFKKINDKYGHLAGDSVLQSMCNLVLYQLRDYDFVARIGGEEFAIVFTDGEQKNILTTVERIRILIEEASFQFKENSIHCTVSFGGTKIRPQDKLESLISRADKNLYQAKKNGRNSTVFSE
ncbi:diguanylate cyclase [Aliikangiella sp. IMCC44359]|uniref:diguanylate cyclase n=1 Tax=Aliikangiella sp. IMCC44359 TaxID=3459125 RepID=UPI00403AE3AA